MDEDEQAEWQRRRHASFGLISQEAARGATASNAPPRQFRSHLFTSATKSKCVFVFFTRIPLTNE